MALLTPLVMQNESYPASALRGLVRMLPGVGPLGVDDLVVSQRDPSPSMSVDVSAGWAVVASDVESRGRYLVGSDDVENVALAAAPGTGNSRIDLIVAEVSDSEYGGGSDEWTISAVTGSPSSSPSAPAVPAGALLLAEVAVGEEVAAVTDSDITDRRTFAGSAVWVGAGGWPAGGHDGQVAVSTGGGLAVRAGGTWVPQPSASAFGGGSTDVSGFAVPASEVVAATLILSSPGAAVSVKADWAGHVTGSGGARCQARIFISLNGGSSYSAAGAGATVTTEGGDAPQGSAATGHRSGLATGQVRVQVRAIRVGGSSQSMSGTLSAQIVPAP